MLEDVLERGLRELRLPAGADVLSRFRVYYDALSRANAVMNLTAITGEDETARKHFLDCTAPLLLFPMEGASLIDVGSGAGFPGLPLKLLCPALRLTLLDSQRKRVDFLREVCAALSLSDVECVHARAEELVARQREAFDFAVSRAVARLNVLCELCLPYVRTGGAFLALKGPAAGEELTEAERAIPALGGTLERVFDYAVPGERVKLRHNVVVIRKTEKTPEQYPRPFAQIKKNPL